MKALTPSLAILVQHLGMSLNPISSHHHQVSLRRRVITILIALLVHWDVLFVVASGGSYCNDGRRYHISGEGLYDPTNPLWREEYQYTGERRGPFLDEDDNGRQNSAITDTFSGSSGGDYVDEDSHERRSPYHLDDEFVVGPRRQDLRPSDGFSRGGGSSAPSSSSPSPSRIHSNSRGRLEWARDKGIFQSSSTSSIHMTRPRTSARRSKGLSIEFQPKRGRVDVDFIGPPHDRRLPKVAHRSEKPIGGASYTAGDEITTSSTDANATTDSRNDSNETTLSTTATTPTRQLVPAAQIVHNPPPLSPDFQLSLSVDPFSTVRLIHTLAVTCIGFVSAFAGTIRLVAPMIAAKRLLTTIGYIFYDHYNGRYIRTTYTRRMRRMQEYEVIAGLRGAGRCLLQILCVGTVARIVGFIMDRAPCLTRPAWICHWWYGTVWISSIHAAGWAMQSWLATLDNSHPLSLRPTPTIGRSGPTRKKGDRRISSLFNRQKEELQSSPLDGLIQVPWHIVQRMRDPEEWLMSMLRPRSNSRFYYSNLHANSQQHAEQQPFKLDTLLFPCTWRPLQVWTSLVVVRAIRQTLTKTLRWTDAAEYMTLMSSKRWFVMRSFLGYEILHGEWKRVFVTERRVALGAFVSTLCLTALLWTVYSVAMVDRITALLLIPTAIARLVSTWMNIFLYYDRCGLPSSFGRSPVPSKRKILE